MTRPLLLALAVLLVACTGGGPVVEPFTTTTDTASTSPAASTPSTAATTTTTTTTPVADAPTVAGISPTGVVVTVRNEAAGRYVVGTPCFEAAVLTDLIPVRPVDVVIDPGHGGEVETGAVGPNGLVEADLNLAIARRLQVWLTDRGITSLLTRTGDYRVSIAARTELAVAVDPHLFISIHHNAGSIAPADEPGTIVFHQVDDPESRRAAGLVYEELVAALEPLDLPWVNSFEPGAFAAVRDRDGRDAYGVLRRSYPVPTILTEALFLQNGPEAEALATERVQILETEALGRAIVRFLQTDDPGSGFHPPEVYTFGVSRTGGTDGCVDPPLVP